MVETVLRLVLSLGVVLVLLTVTARIAGRRFRTRDDSPLRVLHRQPLSRTASVAVVGLGDRVLVLGTTEHQISVLADLSAEEAALWREQGLPPEATRLPAETGLPVTPETEARTAARALSSAGRHVAPGAGTTPLSGSLLSGRTWRQAAAALAGRAS